MKTRSLKLPVDLDEKLGDYARRRGVSRSAVVREAVEAYVVHEPAGQSGSVLARVHDLGGCLEGPADLSTNERYLHGYGRPRRRRQARR